jgi:hypothetical protein
MSGLTMAKREEKICNIILSILLHKSKATSREISYELQVHDIWKSPREITGIIQGNSEFMRCVGVEHRSRGGWNCLIFTLRRDYNSMIGYKEKGGEKHKHI